MTSRILDAVEEVNSSEDEARNGNAEALRQPERARRSASGDWRSSRGLTTCARPRRSLDRIAPVFGASVQAFDPEAVRVAKESSARGLPTAASYDAVKGADALAIVTEWNEFRRPDLANPVADAIPVIFDGRNLFAPEHMKQNGFTYYSIGRP